LNTDQKCADTKRADSSLMQYCNRLITETTRNLIAVRSNGHFRCQDFPL